MIKIGTCVAMLLMLSACDVTTDKETDVSGDFAKPRCPDLSATPRPRDAAELQNEIDVLLPDNLDPEHQKGCITGAALRRVLHDMATTR